MGLIDDTIRAIHPVDEEAAWAADARLNSLTKPAGSLGKLEEIVRRYAATRRDPAAKSGRGAIAVFVADHGVAASGVSAYPQSVTVEMLKNIAGGGAAISVLARRFGYELLTIDMGVAADTSISPLPNVIYRRIAAGTRNLVEGPAMTREQAVKSIEVGIEVARDAAHRGITLLGIGDMGIGNSTSAAIILAAIAGLDAAQVAGRGTGLDDSGLRRKTETIVRALELHRGAIDAGGIEMLAAVGGFEIGAMAGACIGGAAHNVPVVVDGFIATAAALLAEQMCPGLRAHLFFSHRSAEGGFAAVLDRCGIRPVLDLDLRLGEGTGAALAMNVIDSALALFHQMATFASAGVSEKIR
jgi:nicotinate-nucleotide--dimethylbenzimidazole phosphoribosyltransferase